jgi:hypothetical protein
MGNAACLKVTTALLPNAKLLPRPHDQRQRYKVCLSSGWRMSLLGPHALHCLLPAACCLLQAKPPGWLAVHAELFQLLGNHPDKGLTQVTTAAAQAGASTALAGQCELFSASRDRGSRQTHPGHYDRWMQAQQTPISSETHARYIFAESGYAFGLQAAARQKALQHVRPSAPLHARCCC